MAKMIPSFNSIVTAFVLLIGFWSPLAAQTAVLDRLFAELAEAEPDAVSRIEGQIQAEWDRSGSAAMDLLLRRGKDALDEGAPDVAVDHFSALVDHAPDFAEGYNARATAYFLLGAYGPALEDLRMALRLNPRHFGALRGLGILFESIDRPEQALAVYREALLLHPQFGAVTEAVERLEIELEGRSL